jgi:hypothetical protein
VNADYDFIPGVETNDPPAGSRSPLSCSVVLGGRFSAARLTGGQLPAINQAIKQEGVLTTEEQERTIERAEKQGFWW